MKPLWRIACLCLGCASVASCAWLRPKEASQVPTSRYQSAALLYQVAPGEMAVDRKVTLAVRYPHPQGRAKCALVEIAVESPTAGQAKSVATGWLDRMRVAAHEGLVGFAMDDGVEEARAYDLPAAELDSLVAKLSQPATNPPAGRAAPAIFVGLCNGQALPDRNSRVPDLDELILRVRRGGTTIAHRTIPLDLPRPTQVHMATAAGPAAVTADIRRLPPVTR